MPKPKNSTTEPLTQYRKRKNRRAELEREANGIYAELAQGISEYVNFGYDLRGKLTRYQKSKIKKYAQGVADLKRRDYEIYKPRKKKRLATAQKFAQHPSGLKDLKVAFIPNGGIKIKKIKFKKNDKQMIVSTNYITTRFLPFDNDKLIRAIQNESIPEYVEEVIKNDDAKKYSVMSGVTTIQITADRDKIGIVLARLIAGYPADAQNWLIGLNAYEFENQEEFDGEMLDRSRNREAATLKRRNKKARERYHAKKAGKTKNKK